MTQGLKRGLFVGRFRTNACSRWDSAPSSLKFDGAKGEK